MKGNLSLAIAGCFALAAFSIAVIAGVASGNPAASILTRALFAMFICYFIGLSAGWVCRRSILQELQAIDADEEDQLISQATSDSSDDGGHGGDVGKIAAA